MSCIVCGVPEAEFTCSVCERVRYCDAICQHMDWYENGHAMTCDASFKEKAGVLKKLWRQYKENKKPSRRFKVKPRVNNVTEEDMTTLFGKKNVSKFKKRYGKQLKGK